MFRQPVPPLRCAACVRQLLSSPTCPPHLVSTVVQFLKAARVDGAVVVTTPQEVSIIDVRKEINFCKKVGTASVLLVCADKAKSSSHLLVCCVRSVPWGPQLGPLPMSFACMPRAQRSCGTCVACATHNLACPSAPLRSLVQQPRLIHTRLAVRTVPLHRRASLCLEWWRT